MVRRPPGSTLFPCTTLFRTGRHNYGSLGLRAAVLGSFMRLDVARDSTGGTALQGSVQTEVLGVNLFAEHDQFFDFVSERFTRSPRVSSVHQPLRR